VLSKVGFHQEVAVPLGGEVADEDGAIEELERIELLETDRLEVEEARDVVDDLDADLEVEVALELELEEDLEEELKDVLEDVLEADLETEEDPDLLATHAEDMDLDKDEERDDDKEE